MASIRKRGKSQYQVRITRNHTEQSRTFDTGGEAEAWAAVVESEAARGVWVNTREAESTSLREALDRYAIEITPSKKGAVRERQRIEKLQRHHIASLTLAAIRGSTLARYRDERVAAGIGANTIRLDLAVLSHLFTIARKEWGMDGLSNPVQSLRRPRLPKGRDRRLVGGEEERLKACCPPWLLPIVTVAIETAMRRNELLMMRWEDVNLQARTVHLRDTKNGEARTVPLSTVALQVLRELPRNIQGGPVFTVGDSYLSHTFLECCRKKVCASTTYATRPPLGSLRRA
jgi:integrase